jgi:hypothetical protein
MDRPDTRHFHQLYGEKKQRATYQKKDFADYTLMTLLSGAVVCLVYGATHPMSLAAIVLAAFMIAVFPLRHGFTLAMPVLFKRPQDVLYSLVYKIRNLKRPYFYALGVLVLENVVIRLTPGWPHQVELANTIALYLFYGHFFAITAYRTVVLIAHLRKREFVREVLMDSAWKSNLERQPNITLQILHAYVTGVLTHIVYLAPWYLVIKYLDFSLILLPVTCVLAVVIQQKWARIVNDWFYRDHWVGHNSELEFVYLHGTHHDAIPSALIGVAGNGHLEGFFRGVVGFPNAFYNPLMAALYYSIDIKIDIDSHQYIPGVFPILPREFYAVTQHSTHHFGRVEPYSFAIELDRPGVSDELRKRFKILPEELRHSIRLDEQLTGFKWDNALHRRLLELVDKYQGGIANAQPTAAEVTGVERQSDHA